MNPLFWGKDRNSSQGGEETVYVKWTSGASGAVPTTLTNYNNVTSVVHGATGVYVITFAFGGPPYSLLAFGPENIMQASYSKAGACKVVQTAVSLTNSTVTILTVDGDGDAVEPASGDIISLAVTFQRYKGNNNA